MWANHYCCCNNDHFVEFPGATFGARFHGPAHASSAWFRFMFPTRFGCDRDPRAVFCQMSGAAHQSHRFAYWQPPGRGLSSATHKPLPLQLAASFSLPHSLLELPFRAASLNGFPIVFATNAQCLFFTTEFYHREFRRAASAPAATRDANPNLGPLARQMKFNKTLGATSNYSLSLSLLTT